MKHGVISTLKREPHVARPGVLKSGVVEGESVDDILVDSGCSRTMVHRKLVPECKVKEVEAIAMQCVHGDTVLYPLAEISLEVEGQAVVVEAAISNTLPLSMCLGQMSQNGQSCCLGGKTRDARGHLLSPPEHEQDERRRRRCMSKPRKRPAVSSQIP